MFYMGTIMERFSLPMHMILSCRKQDNEKKRQDQVRQALLFSYINRKQQQIMQQERYQEWNQRHPESENIPP